ncbi:hypothetical protein HFP15_22815 [Amycolatopsis sp. K13G38]|uniref:Chaplin domain-containing protein n=1 Tax=Amycolatopsis acididurans TaxID=2724524 RepID=A0ABX1J7E1_9PSEU|nr:hypothetical protein [Amycolatopsis acididurans]NKQ55713.1 hypothetical protein [Amycolatopsis acididurans]
MLKKIGLVTATAATGLLMFGGVASASEGGHGHGHDDGGGQVGLVNVHNVDVAHNVNGVLGACGNDINALGVQVPIRHSLNGVGVPILSPGENPTTGMDKQPYNCASGGIVDGGSAQGK